ncbi:hypothetical protein TGARI_309960 [Toxoplasma gondii ARI]|uniref:KH domain protein n=3 Tax=Toxoplasma gondii TaxID=5811 RepID=A0A086QKB1_TOXGO|nr:hypothetical protein TGVAND_309960 [Toxoplasma gondii VAND]KFH13043.1 hypothetical protein TGMAS_309960 [Toxoplasma gondii MAS]KYF47517.1 hypothetical protein TGARI_309960 [Toxoplasma gondii ARI]
MVGGDARHPSASPPARGMPGRGVLPSGLMPPSFAPHPSQVPSGGSLFFGTPSVAFYPPSAPVPSSFPVRPPHDSMLLPAAASPLAFPTVGEPERLGVPCGTAPGPCGVSLSPLPSSFLPGAASGPPSAFPVYMHPANQPFPLDAREDGRGLPVGAAPQRGAGPRPEGNFLVPLFPGGAAPLPEKEEKKPREDDRRDGRRDETRRDDGRDFSRGGDRESDRLERRKGRRDSGRSPRESGRFRLDGDTAGEKDDWGGDRGRREEEWRDPRKRGLGRDGFLEGREDRRGRHEEFEKGVGACGRQGPSPPLAPKRPRQEGGTDAGLLPTPGLHHGAGAHGGEPHAFPAFRADDREEEERSLGARKGEETGRSRREGRDLPPRGRGRSRGGAFKRGESGHAESRDRGGWRRGQGCPPGGRRRREESESPCVGRQRRRSSETSSSCPRRRGSPSIQRPEREESAVPTGGQQCPWGAENERRERRQSCGSSISSSPSPVREEPEDRSKLAPGPYPASAGAPPAAFFPPVSPLLQPPHENRDEGRNLYRGPQGPTGGREQQQEETVGKQATDGKSATEDGKPRAVKPGAELPFFFDLWVPTTFHPSCPERVRLVLGPKGRTHKEMEQLSRMRIQIYGKEMIRSTRRHGYDAFRDNQPLHLVVTFDRMRREAPCAETAQRAQGGLKAFLEQLVERTWPREETRRPESFYDKQISAGPSCGPLVYVHPLGLHDEPPPKELQGCLVYKPNLFPTPIHSPLALGGDTHEGAAGAADATFSSTPTSQVSAGEETKKFLWGTDFSGRIFGHGFLPRAPGGEEEDARLYEGDQTLLLDCTPPLCLLLLTLQSLHALLSEEGMQSLTVLPARFEEKWGVRLLQSREDFQVAGLHPSKRSDMRSVDKPTGDDGYGGLLSFVQEFPEVFEIVRDVKANGEAHAEEGRRDEFSGLKVRAKEVPEFARVANRFKTTNPWLERGA